MKRILFCFVMLFCLLMSRFSVGTTETVSQEPKVMFQEKETEELEEIDVEQALKELICRYKTEREAIKDEETIEKYNDLIAAANRLLEQHIEQNKEKRKQVVRSQQMIYPVELMVAGATYFGFDLTAELMLHSTNMNTYVYSPIYGGRVIGSSTTRSIAFGTLISGSSVFDSTNTICEKDLCYSILHFGFTKTSVSSHSVCITDFYDFTPGQHEGWIENCILSMIAARNNGQVVEFPIEIQIDYDNVIQTSVVSETNTKWNIEITNNSNENKTVIYNKKLCYKNDARAWNNLVDINYLDLAANQTQLIEIEKNGNGDFVALSYLEGVFRLSTLVFELNEDDGYVSTEFFRTTRYQYENLENIGKDGNEWIIRVKNPSNSMIFYDYNQYMCNYDDARYWENLVNLTSVGLFANQTEIIRVAENGTATSIAIKTKYGNHQYIYTLFDLNVRSSMQVYKQTRDQCTYLTLVNNNKYNDTWYIKVYNFSSNTITIYYNQKLCFNSDARNWQNLNHIQTTTISPYTYTTIGVQENGLGTTAAVSYIKDGKRIISYAYQLNTDGTMIVSETYLEV